MKAIYYSVVNTQNTKERYSIGCNGPRHNATLIANLKLEELVKANPNNSYKVITTLGRI